MKDMTMMNVKPVTQAIPTHDYRPALQNALSWLGKRYLLAEPLNQRATDQKPAFTQLQGA